MTKQVVVIYDDDTLKYAETKERIFLSNNIPVTIKHYLDSEYGITVIPTIFIEKYGNVGAKIEGKVDDNYALEWANQYEWN